MKLFPMISAPHIGTRRDLFRKDLLITNWIEAGNTERGHNLEAHRTRQIVIVRSDYPHEYKGSGRTVVSESVRWLAVFMQLGLIFTDKFASAIFVQEWKVVPKNLNLFNF